MFDKSSDREGSVLALSLSPVSPQCLMQIHQIRSKKRKFLLKKEMEEVKSLIQTKHRVVSQCPQCATFSYFDKNGPAIALVTKPPVS